MVEITSGVVITAIVCGTILFMYLIDTFSKIGGRTE